MPGANPWLWYYAPGRDPESYRCGGDTREQTIAQARDEDDAKIGFTIVEAKYQEPFFDIFDADLVIERYEDRNEECWGEVGSGIEPTPAQKRDLEEALSSAYRKWAEANNMIGRIWGFGETRGEEFISADTSYQDDPHAQSR